MLSLTLPMAARAMLGPFPFHVTFGLTELFKISYTAVGGIFNFSAGLQLCYITDSRWLLGTQGRRVQE